MVRERDLSDECRSVVATEWQAPGVARRGSGVRIFRSSFFEAFTRTPPYLPYVVVSPVVAALLFVGASRVAALELVALALAGVLAWTLVEYLMHRFLFHFPARTSRGRVLAFLVHGHHHLHPDDPGRITATPIQFGLLALLAGGLSHLALGPRLWAAALAGFLIGYLAYEALHFRAHHGSPRTALGRALRRHHLRHHHASARARWGISSPLWDWVFRTLPR
jgi:dihydroceramide fatty acyl 2-hydroxylase